MNNKLTLQKKMQSTKWQIKCFWTVKTQQQRNKKSNIKNPCWSWEFNPGTLAPKADALPSRPLSQLRVRIVVKLFKCFDAININVNKQTRILTHFKQIYFFCNTVNSTVSGHRQFPFGSPSHKHFCFSRTLKYTDLLIIQSLSQIY